MPVLIFGNWGAYVLAVCMLIQPLSAFGIDLLEVYRQAHDFDPTYKTAGYAYASVRQKIPQARAGLLPVLSLIGGQNQTKAESKFSNTPQVNRDVKAWNWSLKLTQPLLRMQNIYAYSAAELLVTQAHAQFAQSEQDLILRVAQAYFDILVAQENIDVALAQIRSTDEQLELAKHGFDAGINAVTDVYEAKSRASLAQAEHVAALNELEVKQAELEKMLVQAPKALDALQSTVVIPRPQPDNVQSWVEQARESNPAVLASVAAVAASRAEISKNLAGHLPIVDLEASYGNNYFSGSVSTPSDFEMRSNSAKLGIQLTVPIFAGGATSSKVIEAVANKNKAESELEVARRQAATDAKKAYAAIVNGQVKIKALESAVESGKSAVDGNSAAYKLGIHMNIDVLNAEQQLYAAQRDLIKARYDTLFQGFKLKAAAGALSDLDVALVNKMLSRR